LPRQARIRARIRASTRGGARRRGDHDERGAGLAGILGHARALAPLGGRAHRRERSTLPRSSRARRRAHRRGGGAEMRGGPPGQHRQREIRGRAPEGVRRAPPLSLRVRGTRGHEPGRAHAPLHGRSEGARLRARGHVGPARRAPAPLAAAAAAAAGGGMSLARGPATKARKKKAEPRVSRNRHPATTRRAASRSTGASSAEAAAALALPRDVDNVEVRLGPRSVRLTNLRKLFWPELGLTKGDLIQYYADVSPWLLPHIHDRAMVMKRYPHGAAGEFFFMKRAPTPRPDWIEICAIEHESGNVIDFPMIQDLPSLLWVINLGCIDLNQWYARCDDVEPPDCVHFNLAPVKDNAPVPFQRARATALIVQAGLHALA